MDSIILMTLWKSLGFVMIIFVAGLVGIPEVYYEAAKIDGATPLRALWHITLPLLKNTTLFILVTQVIGAFQIFTQTYVLTQGGPGNSSKTLVMQIYFTGFRFYRMGEASAMAYILFLILLGLTLVQLKVFKGEIIY
jgi:multiple sugar transport system permease protein